MTIIILTLETGSLKYEARSSNTRLLAKLCSAFREQKLQNDPLTFVSRILFSLQLELSHIYILHYSLFLIHKK